MDPMQCLALRAPTIDVVQEVIIDLETYGRSSAHSVNVSLEPRVLGVGGSESQAPDQPEMTRDHGLVRYHTRVGIQRGRFVDPSIGRVRCISKRHSGDASAERQKTRGTARCHGRD
jgi:hypothetical protein